MNIKKSILETVGNTPLIRLERIEKLFNLNAALLAKAESFNPYSVKDRVALSMIERAAQKGLIKEGGTIIEPTSGNTGIGLAMTAAVKGYKAVLVMPESMSLERRKLLKALGAQIVLTPAAEGMSGAIKKAAELEKESGGFILSQFDNPDNPAAHEKTTAAELLSDTGGKIDIFISAAGTGGTLTGVGRVLKKQIPGVKIIAAEPLSSPVISGGKPAPHKIQGIGAGFIPANLDLNIIDEIVTVSDEDAALYTRELAKTEGLLCGISSGAALCAAVKIAKRAQNAEKNIVLILPDSGERYLSTDIFD